MPHNPHHPSKKPQYRPQIPPAPPARPTWPHAHLSHSPLFFFKPHESNGYLYQWYLSPFRDPISGLTFNCCEQYMMYHKALHFSDDATMSAVMAESRPTAQKALGKTVKGFRDEEWDKVKFEVVVRGNLLKFELCKARADDGWAYGEVGRDEGEEVKLADMLVATGDRELVEASRFDRVWGIGFDAVHAGETERGQWGQNLLGRALMTVREEIRREKEEEGEEKGVKMEDGEGQE